MKNREKTTPSSESTKKAKKKFSPKFAIILVILIAIVSCGGYTYLTYFERNPNGIKNKTYVHIGDNGEKYSFVVDDENITFKEFDFKDTYETLALIDLALEKGLEFNNLNSEEQNELIKDKANELTKQQVFKRNTPYKYTYYPETGLLEIENDGHTISFAYSEKKVNQKLPLSTPQMTLFDWLFE